MTIGDVSQTSLFVLLIFNIICKNISNARVSLYGVHIYTLCNDLKFKCIMNECYIIITIIIESYHAEHSMVYFVLYIYGYGCYNAGIIHK